MDADGNVCLFTKEATHLIVDVNGFHPSTAAFTPIVPQRVLETRVADGQIGYAGAKPTNLQEVTVKVTGEGAANLPADTKSVLVNIASTGTVQDGWIQAYACGAKPAKLTGNLNTTFGQVRSNVASVPVSGAGTICLTNKGGTDIVVDLIGAAPMKSSFVPTTPKRILETRTAEGRVNYTAAKPIAGQVTELKVVGNGTDVPAGTGTVYLNVSGTENEAAGYVTVFPCGKTPPLAASINVETLTTSGFVVADVGDGGRVCILNQSSMHLVVDLMGYFPGTILAS